VLTFLVFALASIGMYEGALAQRLRTLEDATRTIAQSTADLPQALEGTLHARHAAVVQYRGGIATILSAGTVSEDGIAHLTEGETLAATYPKLTALQLRTLPSQGVFSAGRMQGTAGDVVVFATRLATTQDILLVAYDAQPLARHVVAAAALPLALFTLLYALGTVLYFYLRHRVRRLVREQEYVALLANDMRLPVVGLSWALAFLRSGAKRKGIKREELLTTMEHATTTLDDWIRRVIDHTRETRGGRALPAMRTTLDLREVLDNTRALYALYAHARGITLAYDTMPEHIPFVGSRETVERGFVQLLSFIMQNDAITDTLTIAYRAGKHVHEFTFAGIELFASSPRGLLLAQELIASQGGAVLLHDHDTAPLITVRLPRGTK